MLVGERVCGAYKGRLARTGTSCSCSSCLKPLCGKSLRPDRARIDDWLLDKKLTGFWEVAKGELDLFVGLLVRGQVLVKSPLL